MLTGMITVLRKVNYGVKVYYPVCDDAHKLAQIAGTKTLTPEVLRTIRSTGINIQITQEHDDFCLEP
jgi:hypothetical protein